MRAPIAALVCVAACSFNDDIPPPRIASITPDHGRPGASVVVAGSSFCQQPAPDPGDEVDPLACRMTGTLRFAVAPASLGLYTDTSISAIVPELGPGTVKVHLEVGGRSSNGVSFTVE
jgi:hypothetical protein